MKVLSSILLLSITASFIQICVGASVVVDLPANGVDGDEEDVRSVALIVSSLKGSRVEDFDYLSPALSRWHNETLFMDIDTIAEFNKSFEDLLSSISHSLAPTNSKSDDSQMVFMESSRTVKYRATFVTFGVRASIAVQRFLQSASDTILRPYLNLQVERLVILGHSLHIDIPRTIVTVSIAGDLDSVSGGPFAFGLDMEREDYRSKLYNLEDVSPCSSRAYSNTARNYTIRQFMLLAGMNHGSFIKKALPSSWRDNIQAELHQQKGFHLISSFVAKFLEMYYPSDAIANVDAENGKYADYLMATREFVRPLMDSLFVDSHPGLLPPCYVFSDSQSRGVDPSQCFLGSKWADRAHAVISGVLPPISTEEWARQDVQQAYNWFRTRQKSQEPGTEFSGTLHGKNVEIESQSEFHRAFVHFPLHLPTFSNLTDCSAADVTCRLHSTSIYENVYSHSIYTRNSQCIADSLYGSDIPEREWNAIKHSLPPITSQEGKGKFASRQAFHMQLGFPNTTFAETDEQGGEKGGIGPSLCSGINKLAYDYAFDLIRQYVLEKEEKQSPANKDAVGRADLYNVFHRLSRLVKLEFGDDIRTYKSIGPLWIWGPPKRTLDPRLRTMTIRVQALMTPLPFPVPTAGGLHFCKLIPPSSILEWIVTTGLKDTLGMTQ